MFLTGFWLVSFFIHEKSIKTPLLLGYSVTYALREATRQGFTLKILSEKESQDTQPGTILAQKPVPGSIIKSKQAVFVTIAKEPEQSFIPHFAGMSESERGGCAATMGLTLNVIPVTHRFPSGTVIAQTPEPGTVCSNQTVHLFVSSGPETRRIMPDVFGMEQGSVQEFLEGYGIQVSIYYQEYSKRHHSGLLPGTVIAQKPLAGSWVDVRKPLQVQLVVLKERA